MKNTNLIFFGILSFGLFLIVACNSSSEKSNKSTVNTEVNENIVADTETSFEIEGMVCAMGCAAVIQEKLGTVNGVAFAQVNFDDGLATVKYDSEIVSESELIATIEGVGDHLYKAKKVENSTNLDPEVEATSDVLDVVETVVTH